MRVVHMFLADIYLFIDNDNVPQNVCVNGADLKSSGRLQLQVACAAQLAVVVVAPSVV